MNMVLQDSNVATCNLNSTRAARNGRNHFSRPVTSPSFTLQWHSPSLRISSSYTQTRHRATQCSPTRAARNKVFAHICHRGRINVQALTKSSKAKHVDRTSMSTAPANSHKRENSICLPLSHNHTNSRKRPTSRARHAHATRTGIPAHLSKPSPALGHPSATSWAPPATSLPGISIILHHTQEHRCVPRRSTTTP